MSFNLEAYLARETARVEGLLDRALERVTAEAPASLVEAMAYSLRAGGKRLRPVLVLASAGALGREATGAELDFACALEMVHTYSLIHDDLPAMDDDDLRRGKPTSHKRFGEALAILAGDALLTDAFTLLAAGSGESSARLALCAELARCAGAQGMVGGQVDDVEGQSRTHAQLQRLHARKTGALIRAACRGPALAAGGAHLAALTLYGEHLGVAFQIADDLLDVTGTVANVGKGVGKDADKGRVSYPQLLGLEGAQQAAQQSSAAAVAALETLPGDRGPLRALAGYAIARDR